MPKKIAFSVIYVTDEDPKYKSTELNTHAPTVKGWQTSKNCEYPQEIVLQLEKRCTLNKIQILAHQYLIPSKIELFSSNEDTNMISDVTSINWEYLGYITLSDNQSTGFKSRELKSANVPKCLASFIKLNLHKNHSNSYNINNQVSLIAINILGTEIEKRKSSNTECNILERLQLILNDPEYSSPYDDLAFEMYVDTDVVKIIKDMEIKKHVAVLNERFEYARKLKHAMECLRETGEKLGKYELEKKHAIEMEDYERARHKKNQMDEYRAYVYQNLVIEQLLEDDGICSKNDECSDDHDAHRIFMSPTSLKIPDKRCPSPNSTNLQQGQVSPHHLPRHHQSPKTGSPGTGSPTSIQSRGSFRRRNKSAGAIVKSTFEQYEEKPLPALRHSQTNEFLRECQLDYDPKQTSKLTEREKKQAALPIVVFGTDLVEKFYSKHYLDKEEGLNRLKEELLSYDNSRMHTANKTARAAIFLLHRSLRDKVFSVYSLANEVIRLFFVQYVPGRVSPAEVSRSVDKLLPELLTKSGDTSSRIHHMAVHTILTMADCSNVRELHIIPVHLSRSVNSSTHPRLALSRAEMVEQLIINHGISSDKQSEKKEMLERNRVIQNAINTNLECISPEPNHNNKNGINKCQSSSNIPHLATNNCDQNETITGSNKNYTLTKSISGSNIGINGQKKAENENSTSSASGISSPSNNSQKEDEEKHCLFCQQPEASILSVSNSMNSHYWRSCPMLVRCNACSQVVEVSALTEHLLMECEQREQYTQCSQCTEAVKLDEYECHSDKCTELTEGCNRCPLCHVNIEDEENSWKIHLMGEKPCIKNNRVKNLQKQVKIKT